jgi:hypothetical protein
MNYPFKNQALNEKIKTSGYVVLPFFSEGEVEQLLSFYNQHHSSSIPGFYASSHSKDTEFRKLMSNEIKRVILDASKVEFSHVEFLGGSFIVKTKEQEHRLNPHQDWSIVDENNSDSFNIWIPLVDVNQDNGAIRVAPKSHLWFSNYRGPNIPDPLSNQMEQLWESMIDLPMKKGEALIYNHKLYHGSTPNKLDTHRIAAVFGLKHVNAGMRYYFGNNGVVEVYESTADFYLNGNIQEGNKELKLVDQTSIRSIPKSSLPFDFDEIESKKATNNNLFSRLLKKFQIR